MIRELGPSSRAELTRASGLSAPTVSKAAASLLQVGLVEEVDASVSLVGRPAKRLRLAREGSQVLGVVIDAGLCRVDAAGLDGELHEDRTRPVETPATYDGLIDALAARAVELMARPGVKTLGVGVSVPGLIDHRRGLGLLSPNLHVTDGRSPGQDLGERLGLGCWMFQEQHALCLAEWQFGRARGLDDFAMVDVSTGVGLGVFSGGRLVRGHNGFAGEIGHITVDPEPDGLVCGCGNRGCLETVASDSSIAARVSRRVGRALDIGEVVRLVRSGEIGPADDINDAVRYLSIGLAAVINLFNPATLFIHGRFLDADDALFPRLLDETSRRALRPSFADCRIVRAGGSKRQGAVAGVIQSLVDSLVPARV
jgi:N-acetylglucosamine repressor